MAVYKFANGTIVFRYASHHLKPRPHWKLPSQIGGVGWPSDLKTEVWTTSRAALSRRTKALEQHKCGHTPFLIATGLNMVIASTKLKY